MGCISSYVTKNNLFVGVGVVSATLQFVQIEEDVANL